MGLEREIKLEGDIVALDRHPRFAKAETASKSLRSVYFDADGKLRKRNVTLRVRSNGSRFTQTVKAGESLVERSEWEHEVGGPRPDLSHLSETPVAAYLKTKDKLAPVFVVEVERTTFLVQEGRSLIEVALDYGRIIAPNDPNRAAPISEVELELKDGDARDLFKLAHTLLLDANLKIGVQSKAERGFALVDDRKVEALKAEPIALDASMSIAEAFCGIAETCVRQVRLNEDRLLSQPSAEALHQMRVGIRRLRSQVFSATC